MQGGRSCDFNIEASLDIITRRDTPPSVEIKPPKSLLVILILFEHIQYTDKNKIDMCLQTHFHVDFSLHGATLNC